MLNLIEMLQKKNKETRRDTFFKKKQNKRKKRKKRKMKNMKKRKKKKGKEVSEEYPGTAQSLFARNPEAVEAKKKSDFERPRKEKEK